MLFVVFQLSRDVIGFEDSNWRDTTNCDSEDDYRIGFRNVLESLSTTILKQWPG